MKLLASITTGILFFSLMAPIGHAITIRQYIERTMDRRHINSFCTRYDNGTVEKIITQREMNMKVRRDKTAGLHTSKGGVGLTEEQAMNRVQVQMRGSSFGRDAAFQADVPTCRNHNFRKYSRTRKPQ